MSYRFIAIDSLSFRIASADLISRGQCPLVEEGKEVFPELMLSGASAFAGHNRLGHWAVRWKQLLAMTATCAALRIVANTVSRIFRR
jgi:hypothetical protein